MDHGRVKLLSPGRGRDGGYADRAQRGRILLLDLGHSDGETNWLIGSLVVTVWS